MTGTTEAFIADGADVDVIGSGAQALRLNAKDDTSILALPAALPEHSRPTKTRVLPDPWASRRLSTTSETQRGHPSTAQPWMLPAIWIWTRPRQVRSMASRSAARCPWRGQQQLRCGPGRAGAGTHNIVMNTTEAVIRNQSSVTTTDSGKVMLTAGDSTASQG